MYKKLFLGITISACIIFSFTFCLAADGLQGAADSVRNVVGGAENAIEGAAKDVSNASKSATNNMENGANNMTNQATKSNDRTTNYNATRTAATTDTGNTFMGMNSTVWTWLILGIAAIGIIAIVWYYSAQLSTNNHDRRD